MLTRLLELLKTRENGMSLAEISRELDAQPSAVLAMINLLAQKGKLIEIDPEGYQCSSCGNQSDCNLLAARGKRFVIELKECSQGLTHGNHF